MEGEAVGHIYGINLKGLDIDNEEDIKEYISTISNIADDEYRIIYMEEDFSPEIIRRIEEGLSTDTINPINIRLYNVPYLIDGLALKMKRDIFKEEILIISDNKEEIFNIIDKISARFNFVSVFGLNNMDGEEVYEEILEDVGISIYYPKGDSISLTRYGFIINTLDEVAVDFKSMKRNAIVLDFSQSKPFKDSNRYVIEDISLDIGDLGLVENPWIGNEISGSLYTCLFEGENRMFCRIMNCGRFISIENFLSQASIKLKGDF